LFLPVFNPEYSFNQRFIALTAPGHQRAGANLRYFERILWKQLKEQDQDQPPASEEPILLGTYKRPKDHLPEREVYEALCRGEGLQMVREHSSRDASAERGVRT